MISSDSEEERLVGYKPAMSKRLTNSRESSSRPNSGRAWPQEGVSLYNNDLFHDGGETAANSNLQNTFRATQKSSLAAKREERLRAAIAEPQVLQKPNNSLAPKAPDNPLTSPPLSYNARGSAPSSGTNVSLTNASSDNNQNYTTAKAALRGLQLVYDPNEGKEDLAPVRPTSYSAPPKSTPPPVAFQQQGYISPAPAYGQSSQQQQQQPQQQSPQQSNFLQSHNYQHQNHHHNHPPPHPHSETSALIGPSPPSYDRPQPEPVPRHINIDASNIVQFLNSPGSRNGATMCYIVRDRESAKVYPKYMLFLEDGRRFLLSARKRKNQRTSNYIVSLDISNLDRDGDSFFGKVRANFVGTDFTIFDNGEKGDRHSGGTRQELGSITYQYNVLGTRGPRKMLAAIPAVDASGRRMYTPLNENDTILDRVKQGRDLQEIVMLRNKPPRWNEELGAYCLNFNGRVTEASVKNFQLVSNDNLNYVILQFGKIGENTFTMDYQWPISAFQAFCICISSFDNKLACE